MSKPRYRWWNYIKSCLRSYPAMSRNADALRGQDLKEYRAVRQAIEETERLPDGQERLSLVRPVLMERSLTLEGAAMKCHVSVATAKRWHQSFIRLTARHMGFLDS